MVQGKGERGQREPRSRRKGRRDERVLRHNSDGSTERGLSDLGDILAVDSASSEGRASRRRKAGKRESRERQWNKEDVNGPDSSRRDLVEPVQKSKDR